MGRGKKIRPPLNPSQEEEAIRVLSAFIGVATYAEGQRELSESNASYAKSKDDDEETREMHRREAALADRKRQDALAEVLDVVRNRPDIAKRLNKVCIHGAVEDAVDCIERLRTPLRTSRQAQALRSHDRKELPGLIQYLQKLQGRPVQTRKNIDEHLRDALDDPPPESGTRYGGRLAEASAILAELVGFSPASIERIVRRRRKRDHG